MDISLKWIGWNQEDGSDKIWGVAWTGADISRLRYENTVYVFWGARGKTLQLKKHQWDRSLLNLIDQKNRKGYVHINDAELATAWPEFGDMLRERLAWHVLADSSYDETD